jgi:MFS family permease
MARVSNLHEEQPQKTPAYANRWKALAAITMPLIMISIDGTILNVALPSISNALSTTSSQLLWINSGYIIVFGSTIMFAGSMGDKFGRKLILLLGMLVFILGSIFSGLSTSALMLIIARMIQGLGGGLVAPATLSLITAIFLDKKERARAIGIWAGFSGIGVAVGPILGGLLLTVFYWGSVFFVNVPVVITGLFLIYLWVPESKDESSPPIDTAGALLSIFGLLGTFFFLIEAPSLGFSNEIVIGSLLVGLLFISAFIFIDYKKKNPLLDPRLFKKSAFYLWGYYNYGRFFCVFRFDV